MKKSILYLLFFLSAAKIFGQVIIDKSINLSGTGAGDAKISGIKDVNAAQDAVSVEALQKGTLVYAPGTLSGGVYVVNLSPAITAAPPAGMLVSFKANVANAGPVSIQLNALTAIPIKKNVSVDLAANDIVAGQLVSAIYDGSNFQLLAGLTTASVIQNNAVNGNFASGQSASFDITGSGEINGTLAVNGNVGVGIVSPGAKLDVLGNVRAGATPSAMMGTHPSYGAYVGWWKDGADYNMITDGTHTYLNAPSVTGNILFRVNNNDRMFIRSDGNVGIGNVNPASTLFVGSGTVVPSAMPGINVALGGSSYVATSDGTKTAFMGVDGSGYGMVGTLTNHDFVLRSNNTERVRVKTTGDVDFTGIIKAPKLDIATGAVITISVTGVGPMPPGSFPAVTWVNLSTVGYSWATHQNTATDVFSHNNAGTITVAKAGTYMIKITSMVMPTSAVNSWMVARAPFINGTVTAFPDGGNAQYDFGSFPANAWDQRVSVFTRNLAAGTTVQYGFMHEGLTFTYWGHGGYTAMEIIRIN